MNEQSLMTGLEKSPLFHELSQEGKKSFAKLCQLIEVEKGQGVIKEGDKSTDLYFILEGSCQVLKNNPVNNQHIEIALLESGDHFGEAGLFLGTARSAFIVANEQAKLAKITKTQFNKFSETHPIDTTRFLKASIAELYKRLKRTTERLAALSDWAGVKASSLDGLFI